MWMGKRRLLVIMIVTADPIVRCTLSLMMVREVRGSRSIGITIDIHAVGVAVH